MVARKIVQTVVTATAIKLMVGGSAGLTRHPQSRFYWWLSGAREPGSTTHAQVRRYLPASCRKATTAGGFSQHQNAEESVGRSRESISAQKYLLCAFPCTKFWTNALTATQKGTIYIDVTIQGEMAVNLLTMSIRLVYFPFGRPADSRSKHRQVCMEREETKSKESAKNGKVDSGQARTHSTKQAG